MSLLISQCTRTSLRCVLSLPPSTVCRVAKQPSKLRSIITQGIPRLLRGSVTKFHTNWPHQLRNPETDLYWVGWCVCVWLCIVWRETCIIKVASLWKPRRLDAGWLQTVASFYFILSYFFWQRGPGWIFGVKRSGRWSVLATDHSQGNCQPYTVLVVLMRWTGSVYFYTSSFCPLMLGWCYPAYWLVLVMVVGGGKVGRGWGGFWGCKRPKSPLVWSVQHPFLNSPLWVYYWVHGSLLTKGRLSEMLSPTWNKRGGRRRKIKAGGCADFPPLLQIQFWFRWPRQNGGAGVV